MLCFLKLTPKNFLSLKTHRDNKQTLPNWVLIVLLMDVLLLTLDYCQNS